MKKVKEIYYIDNKEERASDFSTGFVLESVKPTPDGMPLHFKKHSDYCGLCNKNTPCEHYKENTQAVEERKKG